MPVRSLRRAHLQQAANLGGDDEVGALAAAQKLVEAGFRKAEAIKRRGIKIADAGFPCGIESGLRLLIGHRAVEVGEGGGAKAQLGERYARPGWSFEKLLLHRYPPLMIKPMLVW